MTCSWTTPRWRLWALVCSLSLTGCSPLSAPTRSGSPAPWSPPPWLDRLGTQLRADKDHWIHSLEASQPSPQQPLRCGLGLQLTRKPPEFCAADPKHHPGCIDGIGAALTCHNL
jgi:hypothetical protein